MKSASPEGPSPNHSDPTSASTAPSLLDSVIEPPRIPDHELVRRIGGGSYGEVWLARSVLGDYRAVKVVYRKNFEHDRPYDREFQGIKNYEPISRTHDSQVDILHVGRNDQLGYFYYVMELADDAGTILNDECRNPKEARNPNEKSALVASNLRSSGFGIPLGFGIRNSDLYIPRTLKRDLQLHGRLPFDECLRTGLALTTALDHLHRHDLVHRDVKPSNIIFINGLPKLADIGLVTGIGEANSLVGTEGYMAPEGPGAPQADLYSLGKVLYEISMGRKGQAFPELPPDWDELSEKESLLELNEVILKACEADLRARYHSAREMHADLAVLQSGKSVKRLRVVERRLTIATRLGLAASGLLVVAALAYLFAVTQARRAEKARTVAEQLLYAADVDLAQRALEAGNLARATALLEGHRPKPGREDMRGFEWYYLKNLCRGDETYTYHGHAQPVLSIAISPDGKLLASCGEDRTIQLWDLISKKNVATLRGHTDVVNALAFSPDGTKLASGSEDKTVKLWDVATRIVAVEFTKHAAAVISLAFSPDGKRLAVGTHGASARLWDISTGQEVHEFAAPANAPQCVAFSPDGRWLAIGGSGLAPLKLWDLSTRQQVADLYEEAGNVNGIAFSPNSRILATTRSDGIYLWDVAAQRVIRKLRGHEAEVYPVAFSPDGKTLASGSIDSTVRLWDVGSGQPIRIFKGHKEWVRSVAFSPDGRTLLSGSMDHDVKLWDLSLTDERDVLRGHAHSVQCVAFSPDDQILATASLDGTVKLWEVAAGTNIATLSGHTAGVTGVAFSHDRATLISCGLDKTVRFWNARTGEQLAAWPEEKKLSCLALSPDSRTLAVGGGWWENVASASEVSFWDADSRKRLGHAVVHAMVYSVSFSPDGKTLAVGMADGSLELLEVASIRSVYITTNLTGELAWSPRSNVLFANEDLPNGYISVFDVATRQISSRFQVPSAAIRDMTCSPDGHTLAIFYATTRIKLCHVSTGREVATLQGHEGFGMCLAFSHDGQTLASASHDRTVRLWRAPKE